MITAYYPWQNAQWDLLQHRVERDQLPHALLLCGAEGVGKSDFARYFALSLLCRHPRMGLPCGVCPSCTWFNAGTHPDYLRIEPEADGKQLKIDQVRELIEFLTLRPHTSTRKVALLLHAEQMNIHTANSLLKSLEEPPPSSNLILVTSNPSMLLATIRSRCQVVSFPIPEPALAIQWLQQNRSMSIAPELALSLAGGSPLRAGELGDDAAFNTRKTLIDELEKVTTLDLDPIQAAKQWLKLGVKPTLYWLTSWMQDMARLKVSPKPPMLSNPDFGSRLAKLSQRLSLNQILQLRDALLLAEQYLRGNMNTSLCIEEWLFLWLGLTQQQVNKV